MSRTYHIKVRTSDVQGAGTDENVYIDLYGKNGRSGHKLLDMPYKVSTFLSSIKLCLPRSCTLAIHYPNANAREGYSRS